MPQIPKNPRKLRRYLENEAHAKEARFWIGRIKSADRMLFDQPTNMNALGELKESWHGEADRQRKRIRKHKAGLAHR